MDSDEWVCAFQQDGFALNLDDYIAKYPDKFGTIYPSLRNSVECADGGHYGIPQDAEARIFFYNKALMRKAGYDDAFTEGLPDQVLKGEVTMGDLIEIAAKVQAKTGAKYRVSTRSNWRKFPMRRDVPCLSVLGPPSRAVPGEPASCRAWRSLGRTDVHAGNEFIFVMKGAIDLFLGNETVPLAEGDAAFFRSTEPHGYANPVTEPAVILWLNSPPTY